MNHFITSAFIVFLFALGAGTYFILQQRTLAHRFFGLFWLSVTFWSFFVAMQFQFLNQMPARIWGWFLHLGCIYIPILFFHFALHFSGHQYDCSKALKIGYLIATTFVLLNTFTDLFTQGTIYRDRYAYPKPAILYPLYILYFQIIGIWSTLLMFNVLRQLPRGSRKILYLFLAVHLLAYLGAMDNYLIMYDIRIFPLYPYGLYLILPYVIFGSYAVLKIQAIRTASLPS